MIEKPRIYFFLLSVHREHHSKSHLHLPTWYNITPCPYAILNGSKLNLTVRLDDTVELNFETITRRYRTTTAEREIHTTAYAGIPTTRGGDVTTIVFSLHTFNDSRNRMSGRKHRQTVPDVFGRRRTAWSSDDGRPAAITKNARGLPPSDPFSVI